MTVTTGGNGRRLRLPLHRGGFTHPRRGGTWTYVALLAILLGSLFPLYWSLVVSSQTSDAISKVPPTLVPGGHLFDNIARVFDSTDFAKALLNSVIVSSAITVSVVFFSTLAGFAFAKLRFRGRQALLLMAIATSMVPHQLGIIPLYILMAKLGWTGRLAAVIVPGLVTAWGLRDRVPGQAVPGGARSGAGRRVQQPGCSGAVAPSQTAAAVPGCSSCRRGRLLAPVLQDNPTVQVALSSLASGYTTDYTLTLTGTVLATAPILIVFLVLGRQIVGGIMQGAVKG
jgi:cellobiose transport system permease protein